MIEAVEIAFPEGMVASIRGIENASAKVFPSTLLGRFGRRTPFRGHAPYMVKTCRGDKSGIRYSHFSDYSTALDYALSYARRVR
jgi:hypothetical protein